MEVYETCGRFDVQGRANSYARAARNTIGSSLTGPMSCNPKGMPLSLKPHGTDAAGFQSMFQRAENGIADGLAIPSSNLCPPTSIGVWRCGQASTAVIGVTSRSISSKS